jgi:hypothetical protein
MWLRWVVGVSPLGKHHEAEPAYGSLGMAVGGVREKRRDIRPSGRVWPCRLSGRTRQQRWLPAKASWAALPSAGGRVRLETMLNRRRPIERRRQSNHSCLPLGGPSRLK